MLASCRSSSGGWVRNNCAFCAADGLTDKKLSWAYNLSSCVWHCKRCKRSGYNPEAKHATPRAAVEQAGKPDPRAEEATKPPEGFYLLDEEPARSSQVCQPALAFLDKRGVTREIRERASIGVALGGRFFGRIIIPIFTDDGKGWLGYVARSWVKKSTVPYLYPVGMDRGSLLYCVDENGKHRHRGEVVTQETFEPLWISEGAFDSYTFLPYEGAAVLGQPSTWQMDLFRKARRPIIFVLDGDARFHGWALRQQLRLAALAQGSATRYGATFLPSGADPEDVPLDELIAAGLASLTL